jgi:hypothetical protein
MARLKPQKSAWKEASMIPVSVLVACALEIRVASYSCARRVFENRVLRQFTAHKRNDKENGYYKGFHINTSHRKLLQQSNQCG